MILLILGLVDLIASFILFSPLLNFYPGYRLIVFMGAIMLMKGFYSLAVKALVPAIADIFAGFIILFLAISVQLHPYVYIICGVYLLIKGTQSIIAGML